MSLQFVKVYLTIYIVHTFITCHSEYDYNELFTFNSFSYFYIVIVSKHVTIITLLRKVAFFNNLQTKRYITYITTTSIYTNDLLDLAGEKHAMIKTLFQSTLACSNHF